MKRIGLLGGSFDPPHNAHLALAHSALEHLLLDELRWVPAGVPWQKQRTLAPVADRQAMVTLAIAGEPRFVLENCELWRSGPSYTIDTVIELQAGEHADWFLVIGQDQYGNLHTWHRWQELVARVTLAVASRDGIAPTPDAALAAVPHRVLSLPLPPMPISATEIRRRIAEGRDYTGMVPAGVARYIDQHRLYRGQSGS
jgi:nicotinate-nucleotide adenylyltransferase